MILKTSNYDVLSIFTYACTFKQETFKACKNHAHSYGIILILGAQYGAGMLQHPDLSQIMELGHD